MPMTTNEKQRRGPARKGGRDRLFIASNAPSRLSKALVSPAGVLVERLKAEAKALLKQAFGEPTAR
jgi:hypothetical protein